MLCCAVFSTLSKADQTSGTPTNPLVVKCDACYSDLDFIDKAKNYSWNDPAGRHVLVYNLEAKILRSVLVQKETISYLDGNLTRPTKSYDAMAVIAPTGVLAVIMATQPKFQKDFDSYVDFVNSGTEKSSIDLKFPDSGSIAATGYQSFIGSHTLITLQTWVQANANLGLFTIRGIRTVNVIFANGDKATFLVTGFSSATNFPMIVVVDENGELIDLLGAGALAGGGTVVHSGGGASTPGGITTISFPSGVIVIVCFSRCSLPSPIIIITPG